MKGKINKIIICMTYCCIESFQAYWLAMNLTLSTLKKMKYYHFETQTHCISFGSNKKYLQEAEKMHRRDHFIGTLLCAN